MKYIYAALLLFSCISFSTAQIETDWVVPLMEKSLGLSAESPFLYRPQVIEDELGFVYNCGFSGGGNNHDLLLGEEEIPAEGSRYLDYYVSQLDANGKANWMVRFSGRRILGYGYYDPPTILPRDGGGITLVSLVRSTVIWGIDTLAELSSSKHLLIAQIDTEGKIESHRILNANFKSLHAVEAVRDGDILIAGNYELFNANIGTETISSNISPSYFIGRLSRNGQLKWLTNVSPEFEWQVAGSTSILEKSSGEVLVSISPSAYNTVIFGIPDFLRTIGLASLNGQTGQLNWKKTIANVGYGQITDMIQVANGDIFAIGEYGGQIESGNGENYQAFYLTDYNVTNGFTLRLNEEGEVLDLNISADGFIGQQLVRFSEEYFMIAGKIERKGFNAEHSEGVEIGFGLKIYDNRYRLLDAYSLTKEFFIEDRVVINVHKTAANDLLVTAKFNGDFLGEEIITDPIFEPRGLIFIAKLNVDFSELPLIPDSSEEVNINIFPNPVADILNVNLTNQFFTGRIIRIFDSTGREVLHNAGIGDRTQFVLDLEWLPPGTYYLTLGEEKEIGKVVPFLKL